MSAIVETIAIDRRLQLAQEEFMRTLALGTNWQKLRIGLRLAMTSTGSTTGARPFAVGMNQGSANGFSSDTTSDYFGGTMGAPTTGITWAYTNSSPSYYQASSNTCYATWKRGSTITTNWGGGSQALVVARPETNRSCLYMDITKGSPNYTAQWWVPNTAVLVQADVSESQFFLNIEVESTPTGTVSGGAFSIAYGGAALLDTVSLYWGRSWPVLEISTLAVCRFT